MDVLLTCLLFCNKLMAGFIFKGGFIKFLKRIIGTINYLLVLSSFSMLSSCVELKTKIIFSCKSPSQKYDAQVIVERFGGAAGGSSTQIIIKDTEGEGARFEDQVFLSEAHALLALEWNAEEEITIYYQEPILVKHWQNWFDARVDGKVYLVSFVNEAEIKNLNCRDKKG